MSIAALDRPVTSDRTVTSDRLVTSDRAALAPVRALRPLVSPAPAHSPAPAPAAAPGQAPAATPRIRVVPDGAEARGFVLYVGLDAQKAEGDGTDLAGVVAALRGLLADLAPSAETHAAVALAPVGVGGRDVDVVRRALQDPSARTAEPVATDDEADEPQQAGIVIDISRKRVALDDVPLPLTYTEYELLQYLVLREGRTVERAELLGRLASASDGEVPNERTIDVHIRRLRAKLGGYDDIVRTVRGVGYRFDRHADVRIRYSSTPSPDLF
jgi:DNA-binding winged helix-turn-helix (wHTH) protein